MTRPLHTGAAEHPGSRPTDGHAGLWFDKFCDRWRVQGTAWTMTSEKVGDGNSPKLEWINTVAGSKVGLAAQLDSYALRVMGLVEKRGGRFAVFASESRFVTGLGRSHPVENGFAWHPTLGTPYLPGSSIKGAVGAWARLDASPPAPCETVKRLFGDAGSVGGICFLDAVPIAPVRLDSDVMTPHYAGWTEENPPGDWRSPTPIPFLVTAAGTAFLFGIIPGGDVSDEGPDVVMSWLRSALTWSGGGAKTAVGYGRFARDDAKTDVLVQRLRDQEREHEAQIRAGREAAQRETRRAAMHPIDREIEEILEGRANKNEPEVTTIFRIVDEGRWSGADRVHAARWLERRMKAAKQWKERSGAKNPAKDKAHRRTLRVKNWLEGEPG